jgi:ABC-type antimicrobial peptide transport system permease subunit
METVKGAIHTRSSASKTPGAGSGRGAWLDAWRRFRSQRWAMAGLVALVAVALVAVAVQ